ERGLRPIVLERGADVRGRRHAVAGIARAGIVDPDNNYCFGEGGAGTFSDGKLYTRATKRGSIRDVLDVLVRHGAPPDILVAAASHSRRSRSRSASASSIRRRWSTTSSIAARLDRAGCRRPLTAWSTTSTGARCSPSACARVG